MLIDPQGVIIGRYGGGNGESDEQLDAKLADLLRCLFYEILAIS